MELLKRILFALKMGYLNRRSLKTYRRDPSLQVKNIFELSPQVLLDQGYEVIVFDYDGVLAAHGENTLNEKVATELHHFVKILGEGKVFILSNKPNNQRTEYFYNKFKGIQFILAKRKKPFPDGILEILQITNLKPKQVLIIDDRLLTGILAAKLAEANACYVTEPMINYRNRPITEFFIQILRKIERAIL